MPHLYAVLNSVPSEAEALLVLNTLVFLQDHRGLTVAQDQLRPRYPGGQVARRLDYFKTLDVK